MKSLVVLSLLLAVCSATQFRPLSDMTTATALTLTVTATFPDSAMAPTLATLTYPTTYSSVTAASFAFTGNGAYFGNNTVTSGTVTFTSGADVVVGDFIVLPTPSGTAAGGGTFTVFSAFTINPTFKVTGSYTAAVMLQTQTGGNYAVTPTTALVAVAATAYVAPAVTAYSLISPQSGGCTNTGCTGHINGTAQLTARASLNIGSFFKSSTAATGVYFYTAAAAEAATGTVNFNTDTFGSLAMLVGGTVGGIFESGGAGSPSATTLLPMGVALTISAQVTELNYRVTWFPTVAQTSVTFNVGTTDVAAPTCTVVSVAPATLTTFAVSVTAGATITVTCADTGTGAAGLWTSGFIATQALTAPSRPSLPFVIPVTAGAYIFNVPPYISGAFTVIGVWAIDNAGNAVVYGSCGGVTGFDTVCGAGGGGASSASSAVASLLLLVVLAFSALFC